MNIKATLRIIEIIFGALLIGAGLVLVISLFMGSWFGGLGPIIAFAGYLLILDGKRARQKLSKKA